MSDDVESVLNELIETSIDGEKAFSKAAEDAQDPELKKLLTQCAYHCQLGASELQSQVQVQGGPPKTAGSLKGSGTIRRSSKSVNGVRTVQRQPTRRVLPKICPQRFA